MGKTSRFEVDAARMLVDVNAAAEARSRQPGRTRAVEWVSSITTAALLTMFILPLFRERFMQEISPRSPMFWANLALAVFFAGLRLFMSDRTMAKFRSNPEAYALRQQREIDRFTTDGWVSRTLLIGVKLGLGVGIPVGLLMVLLPIDIFDSVQDRATGFVGFMGLTFLWAVPAGFLLRWVWLHQARKYRKAE